VPPRTAQETKVITALHAAFVAMMREFDADLQREHRLSHTEYIALMWLSEAPEHTLGLSSLAGRCQQSLSAISRTVGRMETQGLVRREQSTRDARAYNAVLTDAGRKRYEEATPTHDGSLRRYLFDHLEETTSTRSAMRYNASPPSPTIARPSPADRLTSTSTQPAPTMSRRGAGKTQLSDLARPRAISLISPRMS
jgi:DNA-binding MarR family transcriptional regulator